MRSNSMAFLRSVPIHARAILKSQWGEIFIVAPLLLGFLLLVRSLAFAVLFDGIERASRPVPAAVAQDTEQSLPDSPAGPTRNLDTLALRASVEPYLSMETFPGGSISVRKNSFSLLDEGPLADWAKRALAEYHAKLPSWQPTAFLCTAATTRLADSLEKNHIQPAGSTPADFIAVATKAPPCSTICISERSDASGLDFILSPSSSDSCRSSALLWAKPLAEAWWKSGLPLGYGYVRVFTPMERSGAAPPPATAPPLADPSLPLASTFNFVLFIALFEFGVFFGSLHGINLAADIDKGALESFASNARPAWNIFGPACLARALCFLFAFVLGLALNFAATLALSAYASAHGHNIHLPAMPSLLVLASAALLFFFSFLFSNIHQVFSAILSRGIVSRVFLALLGPAIANLAFFSASFSHLALQAIRAFSNPVDFELLFNFSTGSSVAKAFEYAQQIDPTFAWIPLALASPVWLFLLSRSIDKKRWLYLLGKGQQG